MPRKKQKIVPNEYKTWGDDVAVRKLRKNAKFAYEFVQVAARLVAAGHTETDLAFVFGVQPNTISSWKERYPQFERAVSNGKELAKGQMVAQGVRAATGYDYDEVQEEYERKHTVDEETGEEKEELVLVKQKVSHKHVPPNPTLNMFYLTNFDPSFQSLKSVQIDNRTHGAMGIQLTGDDLAEGISKLCAGFMNQELKESIPAKKVESKIIDDGSPTEGASPEALSTNTRVVGSSPDISEPHPIDNLPDLYADENTG